MILYMKTDKSRRDEELLLPWSRDDPTLHSKISKNGGYKV